ncbi:MAG: F0F1 ATP synthase subunit A [Anaerolineae bacterium]
MFSKPAVRLVLAVLALLTLCLALTALRYPYLGIVGAILLVLALDPMALVRSLARVARKPGFWFVAALLGALAANAVIVRLVPVKLPHISLAAEQIARIGPLKVTNTLLASWVTMLVLIVIAFLATRRMEMVPRGLQNLIESVLESLYNFVHSVLGERTALAFPTIATLFFFILVSNWMGLLPGYLSITLTRAAEHGHEAHAVHLLRSAATDLNTTLALAIGSVLMTQVYGVAVAGLPGYLLRFVKIERFVAFARGLSGKGPRKGVGSLFFGCIDLIIGILELFDEFTKVLSFSFRLFGNIFAGEVLLGVMVFLVPFVASLPFLGLELFVGFIQAFVFAVLTAAFIAQATAHHGAAAEAHTPHPAEETAPAPAATFGS